ncbi:DUF982 domain-containing protein [Mesorhizobium sp. BR1-1-2]|uniref:DUF982 domain-containing protein n=1 Tax=Mesorhizobium sp. BR1-1-2 TaxID=2876652 RepID=UPI00398CA2A9
MSLHWFNPPVSVRTGKPGFTYSCNNVEGAARELMGWNNRGPKWDLAVRACMSCLAGDMTPEDVRKAFIAAAEEEGQAARQRLSLWLTPCPARRPRQRASLARRIRQAPGWLHATTR